MAEQEAGRKDPPREKKKEKDKEVVSRSNGNHEKDTKALRAK